MMVHNPMTMAFGDHSDMQRAIELLSEVKESIINAYELKTGQSRARLSHLMESETWMNANKAIELGFADGMLEERKSEQASDAYEFSGKTADKALEQKITALCRPKKTGRSVDSLMERLDLMKN